MLRAIAVKNEWFSSDEGSASYVINNYVAGDVMIEPVTNMSFVYVPAGNFMMGDTLGVGSEDEKPVHNVTIANGFWMGMYEVTQAEWQAVMNSNPSFTPACPTCPVERVSWDEVQTFLTTLNAMTEKTFRLPSEAEWEYAARSGGENQKYSGTSDDALLGDYAWFYDNGYDVNGLRTYPVGTKIPNGLGIYDMSGNVWEWVEDDFHNSYTGAPADGSAWVDSPRGLYRIYRGGGWASGPNYVRSALRQNYSDPAESNIDRGFRLAADQ
jgi:formylglycine-generating enzyme required for sulfatase activity